MFLGTTVCGVVSFLFRDTDPSCIIAIWLAFHGRRLYVSPRWLGITDNVAAAWVVLQCYEESVRTASVVLTFCFNMYVALAPYLEPFLNNAHTAGVAGYIISAVTSVCHTSNVHTWPSLNGSIHCLSAEDRCSCKCLCVETGTRWCWLRTDVARRTGNKRRKLCIWPSVIRMQNKIAPQRELTLYKSLENVADFK